MEKKERYQMTDTKYNTAEGRRLLVLFVAASGAANIHRMAIAGTMASEFSAWQKKYMGSETTAPEWADR